MTAARVLGLQSRAEDDRILPITRGIGGIVAIVLFLAFLVLYGFPDATDEYFAWTITPTVTPIVMGAGYGAGVYFFARVITGTEWHRIHVFFPGIAVFTLAMAVATFIHWDLFNHDHLATDIWVFLYIVTPILIPGLWLLNRRTDPGPASADETLVPVAVRWGSGLLGVGLTVPLAALFINPDWMIDVWPWAVSPLTTRVLTGWTAVFSVANIVFAFERRWDSIRIPLQSIAVGFVLILLGFVRSWADLDPANPLTWVLIGGMSGYLVCSFILYLYMERAE